MSRLVFINKFLFSNNDSNNLFNQIVFIKNNFLFVFIKNYKFFYYLILNSKKKLLLSLCNFLYSKIFLKVGLGFRKKYSKNLGFYILSIGRRYLVLIKSLPSCYFFNIRRRSIFLFSNNKTNLYRHLNRLRILRKETVYKYKGIMTLNRIIFEIKVSRSILFARRVKFKTVILKLTKKQRQKK